MHPRDCTCIRCKVERSSFGTPEAKEARESVSDERVARVVERAKELDEIGRVIADTGVTANTWQSAARRLASENERLREVLESVRALADEWADDCYSPGSHTKCKGQALRRAIDGIASTRIIPPAVTEGGDA